MEAASEKQASDIVLLDMKGECTFADYFVICSGDNSHQIQAIAEEIEARLKAVGIRVLHSEGAMTSGWVLLDFGSLVVHIFTPADREFYSLEKLWTNARVLVQIQ
jgi:ribosome-associated protein